MRPLSPHADLAIAEITFYAPSLLIALAICLKQTFSRNSGWLYLALLPILRLISASCTLYSESRNDYSSSLLEAAAITSSVGTAPLLLVLFGIIERVHAAMSRGRFSQGVVRPLHLVVLVAFVLAIAGGSIEGSGGEQSYKTGSALRKAGSVLFLFVYLVLVVLTVLTASRKKYTAPTDSKLIIASCAVLPFLAVRIIYAVAVSFAPAGSHFYYLSPSVWVTAFMQFWMEAICIVLYSWAGLLTPRAATLSSHADRNDLEGSGRSPADRPIPMRQPGVDRYNG